MVKTLSHNHLNCVNPDGYLLPVSINASGGKPMKIISETETSADAELYKLAEIVTRLRYYTKYWEEHYGSDARARKKYWEALADKWIEELVIKVE